MILPERSNGDKSRQGLGLDPRLMWDAATDRQTTHADPAFAGGLKR
jgi:hypothetical protein